jgi:hypothetical protein
MRLSSLWKVPTFLLAVAALPFTFAEPVITSKSLNPCADVPNQAFYAKLFLVSLTPNNRSVDFQIMGMMTTSGYVIAEVQVIVYGYSAISQKLNPCDDENRNLVNLCPVKPGPLDIKSNFDNISPETMSQIPGRFTSSVHGDPTNHAC